MMLSGQIRLNIVKYQYINQGLLFIAEYKC